jgi:hypothetical protein
VTSRFVFCAAALAVALSLAPGASQAFNLTNNWFVSETPLAPDRVRLSLSMIPLHRGGDGEAREYFLRRAEKLAHEAGYSGFEVLEYREGIESGVLFGQRVADGVVRFTREPGEPGSAIASRTGQ